MTSLILRTAKYFTVFAVAALSSNIFHLETVPRNQSTIGQLIDRLNYSWFGRFYSVSYIFCEDLRKITSPFSYFQWIWTLFLSLLYPQRPSTFFLYVPHKNPLVHNELLQLFNFFLGHLLSLVQLHQWSDSAIIDSWQLFCPTRIPCYAPPRKIPLINMEKPFYGCQQFVHKYYSLVQLGLGLGLEVVLVVILWKNKTVLVCAQSAI